MTLPNPGTAFWHGKNVLVTGHTGFKGAWLAIWLRRLGARVTGISLEPSTTPNLFTLAAVESITESHLQDIRDPTATAAIVKRSKPEIVFHLAAQPLVRASYRAPLETFATNVQGTANLLEALRHNATQLRVVVAITTDKVYRNLEQPFPYRETDALGGHDPYSASKAAAEMVIASYRDAFFAPAKVAVASARAGNVIGGGDWSEDRLIPDAVRAWSAHQPLQVRRPEAIRPWQHVLEPLSGYLLLAETLWEKPGLAGGYNLGPLTHEAATVRDVIIAANAIFGGGEVVWGDGTEGPHEAGWLALEVSKVRHQMGIQPRWPLDAGIKRTMLWYRRWAEGVSAAKLCDADLNDFESGSAA